MAGLGGVEQLTLGGSNALALALTGQAMVWGSNDNGVLGLGSDAPPNPATPLPIPKRYYYKVKTFLLLLFWSSFPDPLPYFVRGNPGGGGVPIFLL